MLVMLEETQNNITKTLVIRANNESHARAIALTRGFTEAATCIQPIGYFGIVLETTRPAG